LVIISRRFSEKNFFNQRASLKTNLPKTSFKLLDDQHDDMIHAIDTLYGLCKNHWDTEDRLYKEGLEKMPVSHKSTANLWAEHTTQHKSFLEKISGLKTDIATHITNYDIPQLHFGPDA
jgi:hypothetical protein